MSPLVQVASLQLTLGGAAAHNFQGHNLYFTPTARHWESISSVEAPEVRCFWRVVWVRWTTAWASGSLDHCFKVWVDLAELWHNNNRTELLGFQNYAEEPPGYHFMPSMSLFSVELLLVVIFFFKKAVRVLCDGHYPLLLVASSKQFSEIFSFFSLSDSTSRFFELKRVSLHQCEILKPVNSFTKCRKSTTHPIQGSSSVALIITPSEAAALLRRRRSRRSVARMRLTHSFRPGDYWSPAGWSVAAHQSSGSWCQDLVPHTVTGEDWWGAGGSSSDKKRGSWFLWMVLRWDQSFVISHCQGWERKLLLSSGKKKWWINYDLHFNFT